MDPTKLLDPATLYSAALGAKAYAAGNALPLLAAAGFGAWARNNAPVLALKVADKTFDLVLRIPGAPRFIVANKDTILGAIDWLDQFTDMVESRLKERVAALEAPKDPPPAQEAPDAPKAPQASPAAPPAAQ